jgi:hypothetical protein
MTPEAYLTHFDRLNLCRSKWALRDARERARNIVLTRSGPIILLGKLVCKAFDLDYHPFTSTKLREDGGHVVLLPHPSGRCILWNQPDAITKARNLLRAAGALPPA